MATGQARYSLSVEGLAFFLLTQLCYGQNGHGRGVHWRQKKVSTKVDELPRLCREGKKLGPNLVMVLLTPFLQRGNFFKAIYLFSFIVVKS